MNTKRDRVMARAFQLPGDEINTDLIIPARFLKCVTFEGLERNVFKDHREELAGKHPFDLAENQGAEILIAGVNFGCGSSREHAVAALQRWGIKAIIARSFANIFRGNSTATGMICVDVSEKDHAALLESVAKCPQCMVNLDLARMKITSGSHIVIDCAMPSADRDKLINGTWNTTATLLQAGQLIGETAARLSYVTDVAA